MNCLFRKALDLFDSSPAFTHKMFPYGSVLLKFACLSIKTKVVFKIFPTSITARMRQCYEYNTIIYLQCVSLQFWIGNVESHLHFFFVESTFLIKWNILLCAVQNHLVASQNCCEIFKFIDYSCMKINLLMGAIYLIPKFFPLYVSSTTTSSMWPVYIKINHWN